MSKRNAPRPVIGPDGAHYPSVNQFLAATGVERTHFYRGLAVWDEASGAWRVSRIPQLRTRVGWHPRQHTPPEPTTKAPGRPHLPAIAPDGTRYPDMAEAARALGATRDALYRRATLDKDAGLWRIHQPRPRGRPRKEAPDVP